MLEILLKKTPFNDFEYREIRNRFALINFEMVLQKCSRITLMCENSRKFYWWMFARSFIVRWLIAEESVVP